MKGRGRWAVGKEDHRELQLDRVGPGLSQVFALGEGKRGFSARKPIHHSSNPWIWTCLNLSGLESPGKVSNRVIYKTFIGISLEGVKPPIHNRGLTSSFGHYSWLPIQYETGVFVSRISHHHFLVHVRLLHDTPKYRT